MEREPIRVLYAREHTTIHSGMGVFLAGPTPPDGFDFAKGWRRTVTDALTADARLCPCMTVVVPEPRKGNWNDIVTHTGQPRYDDAVNKQIQWEWQYLELCRVTAFWLPTYWEKSDPFPGNIGKTSRWEYGYFFAKWEHDRANRAFVAGSPEDAEGVKWARHLALSRGLPWYSLPEADKPQRVAKEFIEALAQALLAKKWCTCS